MLFRSISNGLPTAIAAAIAHNGVEGTKSQYFPGKLDELRLSDIVRNASWIKACYINQNDPSSFYFISQYPNPVVTLVSPVNNTEEYTPVSFTFTPECYSPGGCTRAELWFSTTSVDIGSVVFSDTSSCRQRGVIKDHKLYMVEGGGGCKMVIRDFPDGTILQQSPVFSGASHTNTAPVIDGDMVYGLAHDGYLQAYNETTDSEVWKVFVGPGGSYSTTASTMELYDDHLYIQSKDHIIHKIFS